MTKYIDVSPESGQKFYLDFHNKGKVVMLNLLKFKEVADYNNLEEIKPAKEISGREAYHIYMECTIPHLESAGSRIIYFGKGKDFIIGPESEQWDAVLLIEHESVEKFIDFAQNEEYLKTSGHRTAALDDSRLLPTSEIHSFM